ncbi:MAG: glycosyltransferase [Flavobacterium sp.]|nr:glycosyltransferase [Flavobacterium sp.]
MVLRKIKKVLILVKRIFYKDYFILFKGINKSDILIFDDIFPHPISGFRLEEFTIILNYFKYSKIVVEPTAYKIVNTSIEKHQEHIKEFETQNKSEGKIKLRKGFVNINTKLFYCIFLNNISQNLVWLEKYNIPFVFTLYPGGGFSLNEIISDNKLKKVLASHMFRKVIVTQKITHDYLLDKKLCNPENIEFIFGGVVPQISLNKDIRNKKSYLVNKSTFDICFCAAKYSSKGEDKGYDTFIEFTKIIAHKYDFINFHVVGGFNKNDIDVSEIKERIKFYGYQNFEALGEIYQNMDVLISPNKAFVLGKGAFDGFPLGTVVEAVLNGVVALVTDEFEQNTAFISNEDLIIIDSNSGSILSHVVSLIENPQKLYSISRKGKQKIMEVYSNKVQMDPRINLLKNEIAKIE